MTGVSVVSMSVWSGVVLFSVSHYCRRTRVSCGMGRTKNTHHLVSHTGLYPAHMSL